MKQYNPFDRNSIETHLYEANQEIIHKKEQIKCMNMIKHYEIRLTMTMLQKNHRRS